MKSRLERKYLIIIMYVCIGVVCVLAAFFAVRGIEQNFKEILAWIRKFIGYFSPLIFGLVMAYILNPLAKQMEQLILKIKIRKKSIKPGSTFAKIVRIITVLLSFILPIAVFGLIITGIVVLITGQVQQIRLDDMVIWVQDMYDQVSVFLENMEIFLEDYGASDTVMKTVFGMRDDVLSGLQSFVVNIVKDVAQVGRYLYIIIFGLIFAFYLMMNREYFESIRHNTTSLIISDEVKRIRFYNFTGDLDIVFRSFIRSVILDLSLLSIISAGALAIIGIDLAFILGIIAGYTNLIPYLGAFIGALPIFLVGWVQQDIWFGLFAYFYMLVIQQVYITFVTPKIKGDAIGIHPLFILLAVTVFGGIFGIPGMVLAVPLAGILQVLINRYKRRRVEKTGIKLIKIDYRKKKIRKKKTKKNNIKIEI